MGNAETEDGGGRDAKRAKTAISEGSSHSGALVMSGDQEVGAVDAFREAAEIELGKRLLSEECKDGKELLLWLIRNFTVATAQPWKKDKAAGGKQGNQSSSNTRTKDNQGVLANGAARGQQMIITQGCLLYTKPSEIDHFRAPDRVAIRDTALSLGQHFIIGKKRTNRFYPPNPLGRGRKQGEIIQFITADWSLSSYSSPFGDSSAQSS
jgi:hypothetical protein